MTFNGDHLFLTSYQGLTIVSVADPAAPVVQGRADHPVETDEDLFDVAWVDVEVVGDLAYVAARYDGVLMFDVSDPSAPEEIAQIEREDRTFRLARSNEAIFALGDSEDREVGDRALSIDALDVRDPESSEIVDRLTELSSGLPGVDDVEGNTEHLIAGQDFILTSGQSGSFVIHVDWVEAVDDADPALTPAPVEPTPTPDTGEPISDLPDQDPREVVLQVVDALADEDWDAVRSHSVSEMRELTDMAIRSAGVGQVPILVAQGRTQLDEVENWEAEQHDGWAIVRHAETPFVALVLRAAEGEWRIDPGFRGEARAEAIDLVGFRAAQGVARWLGNVRWEGDAETLQVVSTIDGRVEGTRASDNMLDVAIRLEFLSADHATVNLDGLLWSVGDAEGQAEVVWTTAHITEDWSEMNFPLVEGTGGEFSLILRAEGVPDDAEEVEFRVEDVYITGIDRGGSTAEEIDELTVTGTLNVENRSHPDLGDIDGIVEVGESRYQEAIAEAEFDVREPTELPFEAFCRTGDLPPVGGDIEGAVELIYAADTPGLFVEVSQYRMDRPNASDADEAVELADGTPAEFTDDGLTAILAWNDEESGIAFQLLSGSDDVRLSREELIQIADRLE